MDFSQCRIEHPDGVIHRARFVFINGVAAAWVEDRVTKTAQRALFATGATYSVPEGRRMPHTLTLPNDGAWIITQVRTGGGGCACQVLRHYTLEQLLVPDLVSVS